MALLRSVSAAGLALAALLAVLSAPALAKDDESEPLNKFIVTYSLFPDPFHFFSFYNMPRTIAEAKEDSYAEAEAVSATQPYSIWCRKNDYRVCVLFDKKGNVAGIQVSAAAAELAKSNNPLNLTKEPQWERKTVLGVDVWTTTAYFVHPNVLHAGGRELTKDTPTAHGFFIKERDNNVQTIPFEEEKATEVGYTKQGCFYGMGQHYFYNTTPQMSCDDQRPYFLLYGKKTNTLHGFGITQYGKTSQGRGWFETPPALVVKYIAPYGPKCLSEWINKYGMFTIHVYFRGNPRSIRC